MPFVPDPFEPPLALDDERFLLRPLGPEHNDADYAAWTGSMDHIHATPGFETSSWPHAMTRKDNRGDLVKHADDFVARTGFTYTVLDPVSGIVIGCVYIYPSKQPAMDAGVRSWVRHEDADLDAVLYRAVSRWLATTWPFERVEYAERR